jgi:hypothetical protein
MQSEFDRQIEVHAIEGQVKEYVDQQQSAMWEHIRARSGGGGDA